MCLLEKKELGLLRECQKHSQTPRDAMPPKCLCVDFLGPKRTCLQCATPGGEAMVGCLAGIDWLRRYCDQKAGPTVKVLLQYVDCGPEPWHPLPK